MRRIIDKRKKEKYMLDDEYLNGMARLCGWQGTIVYNSLCRHADKNQKCFPSIKLLSEQHGVSRPTILKGIDNLEKRGVIEVKKTRSKGGQWLNNEYILLDKSGWIYNQVNAKQINEIEQKCLLCGINIIEACHIEPRRDGGTISKANIVYLCPTHHTLFDREKLNVVELKEIKKYQQEQIILLKGKNNANQVNEVYLDKMINQVNESTPPSKGGLHDQVNEVDTKETHKQGNTFKETHIATQSVALPFSLKEEYIKAKRGKLTQNIEKTFLEQLPDKIKKLLINKGISSRGSSRATLEYNNNNNNMKYKENLHSDNYEDVIDIDSGEKVANTPKTNDGKKMQNLMTWAEGLRGRPFVNRPKQMKAISIMKKAKIKPNEIKRRWLEMSKDDWWREKGFDFMNIANSFNKK